MFGEQIGDLRGRASAPGSFPMRATALAWR